MRNKHYLSVAALTAVCIMLISCQGRRADATSNGETVDVYVEKATPTADTAAIPETTAVSADTAFKVR